MNKRRSPPRDVSERKTRAELLPRIRVLVADPHDITLVGTRAVLNRAPHIKVVGQATTAAAALAALDRHAVDLAIVDLRLDGGKGIAVCARIRSSFPNTQTLILTGSIDDESVFSALQAGVAGLLVKSVGGAGLVRAIEAVCDGHMIFNRNIFQPLTIHLCNPALWTRGKARAELSGQEQRVMALVAEGQTNKEIAVALGLSDKTVKNYLYRVYEKLQATRRAQATKMFLERTRSNNPTGLADFGCPLLPVRVSNKV